MSKDWRTILRFAVLGSVVSTASFLYILAATKAWPSMPAWAGMWTLFLSPGTILFGLAIDVEQMTMRGYVLMWLFGGLLNFPLYAAIGGGFVGFRRLAGAASARKAAVPGTRTN
jgi:hypothetical protein